MKAVNTANVTKTYLSGFFGASEELESAGNTPVGSEFSLNALLNVLDAEESESDGVESLLLGGGLSGELGSELGEEGSGELEAGSSLGSD